MTSDEVLSKAITENARGNASLQTVNSLEG